MKRRLIFFIFYFVLISPVVAYADSSQIFDSEKTNVFVAIMIFSLFFFGFLMVSRKGMKLHLREIPGIAAIEEAVGRATEMGRPVLFIPGLDDIDEIQTLAGIAILSHVAKIVADYESDIIVPTRKALTLSICEETVREGYAAAGRPDAYKPDNIRYLSDEQFAFTAGVDGIILREKPAANIYLGMFYAESLILAENGFASGAIQVAGTAAIWQIPFFITSCDFTLIAEEFFAASAYLSKNPKILASIKASDYFKLVVIGGMILGIVCATFAPDWLEVLRQWF